MYINGDEGSDNIPVQSRQMSSHQSCQGIQPLEKEDMLVSVDLMQIKHQILQ